MRSVYEIIDEKRKKNKAKKKQKAKTNRINYWFLKNTQKEK